MKYNFKSHKTKLVNLNKFDQDDYLNKIAAPAIKNAAASGIINMMGTPVKKGNLPGVNNVFDRFVLPIKFLRPLY